MVTVSVHAADEVFVPSDSTLRLSIRPVEEALNTAHSCQAKLASVVAKVERNTMLAAPDVVPSVCSGYVASIALRSLFVAACKSVCVAAAAVVESPTPM
jgi:ribonuclease HII